MAAHASRLADEQLQATLRVLADSIAFAGDIASRNVMKVPQRRKRTRELDHVPSSADVHAHRGFARDSEIVEGSEMKDARGLLFGDCEVRRRQTKLRLRDVALNDLKIRGRTAGQARNAIDLDARAVEPRRLHQQNEATLLAREPFE